MHPPQIIYREDRTVRPALHNRDPGDEQTSLYDSPAVCPHCNTTRPNLCAHDADVEHGDISASARRPQRCLNAYDPKTAAFPDGF